MTDHPHGTPARYSHGPCRCDDCTRAATLANKRRKLKRARTGPAYVPAAPARKHLQWLASQGIHAPTIATLTGISVATIISIRNGQQARTTPTKATLILAVSTAHRTTSGLVPAGPSRARVAELVANGWTQDEIGRLAGYSDRIVFEGTHVRRDKELRIEALHTRLMAPIIAEREWMAARQRQYRRSDAVAAPAFAGARRLRRPARRTA